MNTDKKVKIACNEVSKTFYVPGQKQLLHVLNNVSLKVYENEFMVILGPGQSGKTVLLNCVAGLLEPTAGSICINDVPISGPGTDRGMVFQRYALFPWKTVEHNVAFGLAVRGVSLKERLKIAHKYIELVGLAGFEKAYPAQLSGGMKQRVGIARAYALNPEVLLLDEPFGQLDAQTRFFMEQETERIWHMDKRTMIFVTNNIDEALFLADRIVTMEDKLPGHVHTSYDVPLPRPRDTMDPAFLELRARITEEQKLTL